MPVHLLLLCIGPGGIIVARALLDAIDVGLQLGHELVLPRQAGLHFSLPLLLLFVKGSGVVLESLRLLVPVLLVLEVAPLLVGLVLLEDFAHVFLLLLFFLLKTLLLGLHLRDDFVHQRSLLVLFLLQLLLPKLPLESQLSITVLLLLLELRGLLFLPQVLHLLPTLELDHRVLVVSALLLVLHRALLLLLVDLAVQVHTQLLLQRLDSHVLPDAVLLVQVRRVLVQLRPVVGLRLARGDHVLPGQRSDAPGARHAAGRGAVPGDLGSGIGGLGLLLDSPFQPVQVGGRHVS
mmetsp:Transcript_149377/g.379849  ORF Transcript_149377/g.379849 Transcript_149377/m.379849 type:complete len:292 (+) Transcript_149377:1733-2608(+)